MRKNFIVPTRLPRRALSRFNIGKSTGKTTKGESRHMADWQSLDPEAAREAGLSRSRAYAILGAQKAR